MSEPALGIVTAAAQIGLSSIIVRPYRAIGDFVAQVTLEEQHHDELEITDHPVEQGSVISDHAYRRPSSVIIKCGWSNSPSISGLIDGIVGGVKATVTGAQSLASGNSVNQVRDVYAKLLKLQASRVLFDIYTGKRVYKNMLIKSLSQTTNPQSENSLMITAECREVIIVQTQTVAIQADPSKQKNPGATQAPVNTGVQSLGPGEKFVTPGTP